MRQRLQVTLIILLYFFPNPQSLLAQDGNNLIPDSTNLGSLSFSSENNRAETEPINETSFAWHDPITQLPEDLYNFGKRTLAVDNVPTLAGLVIATGLLMSVDHETSQMLMRDSKDSPLIHDMNKNISYLGDGQFHLMVACAFGGLGLIFKNDRAVRTALQILEAELITGATVQVLKRVTGRESPQSASRSRGIFRPFPNLQEYSKEETKYYSFPSGHVSTSMAVLTVIAENYPEITWIKPLGYATIGLIAVSLVGRGWHWFSDYPLAIAIGYTFGKVITNRNEPKFGVEQNTGLSIHPTFFNGTGIELTYRF
jgi:membrane-associated phospholipid phosphatase